MRQPRALFAIPTLDVGGAQRVLTTVLHGLAGCGVELHLAYVRRDGPMQAQVAPEVVQHNVGRGRTVNALPKLRRLIRRLQPDVVFSTAFSMNLGVTLLKPLLPRRTRVVIREVSTLNSQVGTGWRGIVLRRLAADAFRRADAIICQSEFMRDDLSRSLGLPADLMRIVPNPVDFARIAEWSRERNPFGQAGTGPHVLAVGRLVRAKGFDRLLHAFPALRARRPAAQLWIVGDGPERESLEHLALELGIASAVHFAGMQQNPYCWMRHADLMAVSSRREGMPNAVLEAIACGCPLVVLDHPGGTREALRLTGQAERVVSDLTPWQDAWFQRPAPLAQQRAREHFDRDVVVREYLRMIEYVMAAASPEVAPLRTPAAA